MTKRDLACGLVLLALALLARSEWFSDRGVSVGGDQLEYHRLAARLAEGRGYTTASNQPTAWRPPGLPIILSAIYRIAGPDPVAGQITLVVLTSFTAPALYALYLALFNEWHVAFLAGLAWALLPFSRRMAGLLLGEPLTALLVTLVILATLKAHRSKSALFAALAGGVLGYAVLIRTFLFPVAVGPLAWLFGQRARRSAAVFALSFVLPLGGWVVRNLVVMGTPALSTQTLELWQGNNAWARGSTYGSVEPHIESLLRDGKLTEAMSLSAGGQAPQREYLFSKHPGFNGLSELERSRLFVREAISEIIQHPVRFAWLLPRKAALFFSPVSPYLGADWLYALILPLSMIGVAALVRLPEQRDALYLLVAPVGIVFIGCLVLFGDPRFRHPMEPLMVVAAGFGCQWLVRGFKREHAQRRCQREEEAFESQNNR